jgi:DNA-binding SARP family transcriptional activator/tetratricopeptide (TPR) repeat protein
VHGVRFRVLGPVEIDTGAQVLAPVRRQLRCLLAILLLESGRIVPIDRLCDLLWDDDPPAHARRALRSHIAHLRALLADAGGGATDVELELYGTGYSININPDLVDAHRFRTLVAQAMNTKELADRDRLLHSALALWRGPALQNAAPAHLRERLCADLDELRLYAIEESVQIRLALGQYRELIPELGRLTAEHPARERLTEMYMTALYAGGRTVDALDAYARLRTYLAEEHGLDPAPALNALQRSILRGEPVPTVSPGTSPPGPAVATETRPRPAQLPNALSGFVGRADQLRQLNAAVTDTGTTVVISAVAGTAGVGKTTLAVHWAHSVANEFPDGQLYVNLRGFGSSPPMTPGQALRGFLDALDVPVARIPTELDAQIGLYRSLIAGRRVLVILDNARDAAQARPLLPGTPGCLAVVTSRNQMQGLVATEGARVVVTDLFNVDDARTMLARRVGQRRLDLEPAAVTEIIAACSQLPLALAVVAARIATQPSTSLASVAADLRSSRGILDVFANDDDMATDIRTIFSWSYAALSEQAARLFRLLAAHPGPDLTIPAAASLAGIAPTTVRRILRELTRAYLLTEDVAGRYSCHDLLRAFAADLLGGTVEDDRRAATHRILDHYLHTAVAADRLLSPVRDPVAPDPAAAGVTTEKLVSQDQALAWFTEEHPGLIAAVEQAAAMGFDRHAAQLAWSLTTFLDRRALWHDLATAQQVAVTALHRIPDLSGQAAAYRSLSLACVRTQRYDEAAAHLAQSLALYRELDDRIGQAHAHLALAIVHERGGQVVDALAHSERALALYSDAHDRAGEARALNSVGWYQVLLGQHGAALASCELALDLHRDLDNRYGQAATWDSLGLVHHHLGDYKQAARCYEEAVRLHRTIGDRGDEADVQIRLGDNYRASGLPHAARDAWKNALELLDELDHPGADEIRTKLRDLEEDRPLGPP